MSFLNKLKESISNFTEKKAKFDPSMLNDEVAMMTEWNPAKSGGTNICTHSLKRVSSGRLEFKTLSMALLFPSIFMLIGIGVGVGMTISGLEKDITALYIGLPFGIVFFLVGFFLLRSWTTPRVFDLDVGYYWKGRNSPNTTIGSNEQCKLDDIHAIQLLKEYCRSDKSSYYSYELNLVLKDGNRLNVVDHGKLSMIQNDAEKLSQFLDIPVWDTIS